MTAYKLQPRAKAAIEEIYRLSRRQWGEDRADAYVGRLFDTFQKFSDRQVIWQPIPVALLAAGYRVRYERHQIYWRLASDGTVIVFAILHERMNQIERLMPSFGEGT